MAIPTKDPRNKKPAAKPIKPNESKQMPPSPMALKGRGGRSFNVPGAVWAGVPESERAGLQDAFARGGIGALRSASTGKPWADDLTQAVAGARGAVQNRPGARPAAGTDTNPRVPPILPTSVAPTVGTEGAPEKATGVQGAPVVGGADTNPPVPPTPPVAPPVAASVAPGVAPDGGPAGGGSVDYRSMQGGKGGYTAQEWEGLRGFIGSLPAAQQAQIYAGLEGVPGQGGGKFDYLLSQIKKFSPGGGGTGGSTEGGPVSTTPPGPGQRPDAGVPAGGITNNWKPNDPNWIREMDAKFGQGAVWRAQQAMNEAVKDLPDDGSGARRAAIYKVLQQFGFTGGAPTPQQPPIGVPNGLPPQNQTDPFTQGGGSSTGAPPTPGYVPPPLTQTQQAPPVNPPTGLPNILIPF